MSVPYAEVIGDPISHSKSPLIHQFWLKRLGVQGEYRRVQVGTAELEPYLQGRREDPDWRGCNVTAPHKIAILPLIDNLYTHASATGAVNTVFPKGGSLSGNNSDLDAYFGTLQHEPFDRRAVLIIGAGGAAHAALIAARAMGFETIHLANRTPDRAAAMLQSLPGPLRERANVQRLGDPLPPVDLLLNASAMGTKGVSAGIDLTPLPAGAIVLDMVYNPVETKLLADARSRGLRTIDGLTMLIEQAKYGFRRFFGADAPAGTEAELRELLTS